ncbi:tRNA1(Val) (adenine(37)-N6)-methyltransferase [Caldisalinibacter kiritimatiensis]|uniref:Methyltransferase small n=1 Tax=Caldisalinibacter kiritimatiensis TaxID=1304284 RepID=R1AWQ5_9FIRM|nr:tRNA1(Val) (adenine(37)-N6)-methyltransferase [Caldisalinibacter kiritimatiensis]EOD01062.1 Methyltransferase small [Caldisalinibacter kiritimatiensis]
MNEVNLKPNERIDDLQLKGLKIIQNPKWFCFGMDAVLLANYCDIKPNSTVVDLGTGTGIIPLIIWGKNKVKKIYGIEIQQEVAEMAQRTVKMNKIVEYIEILNIDLRNALETLGVNKYDVVTSNPPYKIVGAGKINPEDKKAISRHEIMCTLEDVIRVASRLLKHNGRFFLVHRPDRIVDIMCLLRKYKLEPKAIRFVHPKVGKKPNLVLIKSIKAAKPELKFQDPLYVYNDDGTYTDEIYEIYGMEK